MSSIGDPRFYEWLLAFRRESCTREAPPPPELEPTDVPVSHRASLLRESLCVHVRISDDINAQAQFLLMVHHSVLALLGLLTACSLWRSTQLLLRPHSKSLSTSPFRILPKGPEESFVSQPHDQKLTIDLAEHTPLGPTVWSRVTLILRDPVLVSCCEPEIGRVRWASP
ncbi:hypothetical protein KQX54_001775 [Cotesia glomerata]|uniref:Uncharacterized protein n=1 Tax=Cotesia glomerata TaxID=32391 RepID=A0AAV7IPH8_COTGL|nr:hypothetical protein KQX54_001775 [Cotesia glomerata]